MIAITLTPVDGKGRFKIRFVNLSEFGTRVSDPPTRFIKALKDAEAHASF
jgi:hypothetical protein